MYTPHTVTLIIANETDDGMEYHSVVLNGVFIDRSKRAGIDRSGLSDGDNVTLYIPMGIDTGKMYLAPKAYRAATGKDNYWTLSEGGETSGAECYFVKGEAEAMPYEEACELYDDVYRISAVDELDYGSEAMRHWEVTGV